MTGVVSKQFGRYEIRSKLGEGGMGEVYAAHDAELDRSVAIKLLPGEFSADQDRKSRFKQEARVVSALNHPNVITIYEIGENEHGSFLATEYVDGKTLREVIKNESLTLPRILKIVEQVANGLVAAHQAKIIHRDIKPENIMVRRDSIVKVLDFGLAKPAIENSDDLESNKTIPGTVMGSARYMSPEQARGLAVDERTDIWSLGVVLYEMLVGNAPFNGETTADTIASVIYKEPEPLNEVMPNLPEELHRIVRRALQKDRDERYQSVKDFALDIKNLLHEVEHANSGERSGGHTTSSPRFSENPTMIHTTTSAGHPTDQSSVMWSTSRSISNRPVRRSRIPWLIAAAFAVVLIAGGGYVAYRSVLAEPTMVESAFEKPQITRINTDGRVLMPTISPDGKYVAYVAGENGNRSLVVRQISTDSTVTVVPPTNLNIVWPIFSPGGDYIYYCLTRPDNAVNTLYQVPTLGGTPKKLIEDVDGPVTFAPDAKRFAFIRHASTTNEDVLYISDGSSLAYEPLISTTDTEFNYFANRPSWSPDGKVILIGAGKRQGGFNAGIEIAGVSTADKSIRKLGGREFYTANNFSWFADGSGFLFSGREVQNGPAQVWRVDYPQMQVQGVTNDFNDYNEIGLSANAEHLVTVKADTIASLWSVSSKGDAPHQLTNDSRSLDGSAGIAQFPNGRLVFSKTEGKNAQLWTSDADGSNPKVLWSETGWAVAPVATADGKYIVVNLQKDKQSRIWRMDPDGKNPVMLADAAADVGDFNPQVTPDGKNVIFQRQVPNEDRFSLVSVPIDGGPVQLFYAIAERSIFAPRVSPDGKRIAFGTYNLSDFRKKIVIASLENGKFGKVERELEHDLVTGFTWSPDGKDLTIITGRSGVQNIWRQPLSGVEALPITQFKSGRILNFAWSADGKEMLISRGNTNNDLILIRDSDRIAANLAAAAEARARDGIWPLRRASFLPSIFN